MKFLIMIYHNPESRAIWAEMSPEDQNLGLDAYEALDAALTESGELIASERLAFPETARRVSVRDGKTISTDGPFAEVKEQLAGFYLVDCEDIERATEIAGQIPEAFLGMIEVRPVMGLRGPEM
ncbi:YciI family protein [Actinomadura rudentiformis]|uniref:YciI family protein n=1 Tax=Actinomadura rudentiformis TaxID=359158 RepID=A0A6H9YR92_9ACTN|nr:YciI family protein [Actinomadura rudentiformis]KAB2346409.1 YciI family protein [Actinomadura rudentiformis]